MGLSHKHGGVHCAYLAVNMLNLMGLAILIFQYLVPSLAEKLEVVYFRDKTYGCGLRTN